MCTTHARFPHRAGLATKIGREARLKETTGGEFRVFIKASIRLLRYIDLL